MNIPTMPVCSRETIIRQFYTRRDCVPQNRKRAERYTAVNRWCAIGLLVTLSLWFLVQCASSVSIPPRVKIVPVQPRPSATKPLNEARRISARTDVHSQRASDSAQSAKSGLTENATEMSALVVEVGRLHKQQSANANELLALYNRMVAAEKRSQVLLIEISVVELELAEVRTLRNQEGILLMEALERVENRDSELIQVRGQLANESAEADRFSGLATTAAKAAADSKATADRAKGMISTLIWILAGVSVALTISLLVNVIQFRS